MVLFVSKDIIVKNKERERGIKREGETVNEGCETQKERDRDTGKERERKTLITTGYFVFIITKRGRKPI